MEPDLDTKAERFLKHPKKHKKTLQKFVSLLQERTDAKQEISEFARILERIFKSLLETQQLSAVEEFTENYNQTWDLLLRNFEHDDDAESMQALESCMEFLALESAQTKVIALDKLTRITKALISHQKPMKTLHAVYKMYTKNLDILEHTWSIMHKVGNAKRFAKENFALNYLSFIELLNLPAAPAPTDAVSYHCFQPEEGKTYNHARTLDCLNRTWDVLLSWCKNPTEKVHRQLLIVLLERFLPYLRKPIMLTDLLMESLNKPAPINLLALQCMFKLIQEHNITYPGLYNKLYSMFTKDALHMKYKQRLLHLADIFLTSTHLPKSLVAGFVKRFARLALTAPLEDVFVLLRFIQNLLIRHPSLQVLISAPQPLEVDADPYIEHEPNPAESKALESSLWELALLQHHAVPGVAIAAKFITQPLPSNESPLGALLDQTAEDIFADELKKAPKEYYLACEPPQGLFLPKDDFTQKYFQLF